MEKMKHKQLLIALTAIALVIAGVVIWQQFGNAGSRMSTEASPSPGVYETVIEEETLTTDEGVEATVDAEVNRIDAELQSLNEADFSTSGLSNTELGL